MTSVILFVDHAGGIGGAEVSLLSLCENLDRDQWEPHLIAARGEMADRANSSGLVVHSVELPRLRKSPGFLSRWVEGGHRIARIAGECQAAVIYSNTVRATIYSLLGARLSRRPLVWHMRDFWLSESEPSRPEFDWALKKFAVNQARRVIANSHCTAGHLPPDPKVSIVYNGVDPDRFNPDRDRAGLREQYGLE
ncbi:MAG: glycosyltransferase, partial [Anaerolineales bacterium]|nr:glycosyltransferase [Anaerolineales bacterium]